MRRCSDERPNATAARLRVLGPHETDLALLLGVMAALAAAAPSHATFPGANGRIGTPPPGSERVLGRSSTLPPMGSGRGRDVRFLRDCQLSESGEPDSGDCTIRYRSPVVGPERAAAGLRRGSVIALVNSDRSGYRQLSRVSADDGEPAFSPCGSTLAFTARRARGATSTCVPPAGGGLGGCGPRGSSPDWSARGLIAFERGGIVYSVKPSGGRADLITRGSHPSWSPTGRSDRLRAPRRHLPSRGRRRAACGARCAARAARRTAFLARRPPAGLRRGRPAVVRVMRDGKRAAHADRGRARGLRRL